MTQADQILLNNIPQILNDKNIPDGEEHERINNEEDLIEFISKITSFAEDFFGGFSENILGVKMIFPKVVIFDSESTVSGCGIAGKEIGPFYCPGDNKIYLNPAVLLGIAQTTKMQGDAAIAYIIFHEYSHAFQQMVKENFEAFINFLGSVNQKKYDKQTILHILNGNVHESSKNQLLVHIEQWADYLAGVCFGVVQERCSLHDGDLDEAVNAAAAIGDDIMQMNAGMRIDPHKFTHGSSRLRKNAVKQGIESGLPFNSPTVTKIAPKFS